MDSSSPTVASIGGIPTVFTAGWDGYLYGVRFEPATLKLALLEASKGKIGSTWERFILYCYHYDAGQGRYAPAALSIMRVGGALTVLVLSCVIGAFWLRDRRKMPVA